VKVMLSDVPDGVSCFVDANILCYHIIHTPPLSAECTTFIKRIEQGAVKATTSAAVVAEAIHKVMLAEAIQRYQLDHRGLAHRLQRQREVIAGLSEHRLLTNDAVTIAVMEKLGLIHLVTNDNNFDAITHLSIWKPR
jgi:predicted nucleic acid-binding protein